MPEIELSRPGFIEPEYYTSGEIEIMQTDGAGYWVDYISISKLPSEVEILCDDGCGIAYRMEPIGFYREVEGI